MTNSCLCNFVYFYIKRNKIIFIIKIVEPLQRVFIKYMKICQINVRDKVII